MAIIDRGRGSPAADLAVEIVSAYVANNSLPAGELATLIARVHQALNALLAKSTEDASEIGDRATPAQIRESIRPDGLISFIDGRPYKTLKRHLTAHGFDASSYRLRFGLPSDYPMVASAYAARRSELAKSIGLGRTGARALAAKRDGKGRGKPI